MKTARVICGLGLGSWMGGGGVVGSHHSPFSALQPPRLGILCAESPGGGREGDTAQGWVVKQQTGVNRGPVRCGCRKYWAKGLAHWPDILGGTTCKTALLKNAKSETGFWAPEPRLSMEVSPPSLHLRLISLREDIQELLGRASACPAYSYSIREGGLAQNHWQRRSSRRHNRFDLGEQVDCVTRPLRGPQGCGGQCDDATRQEHYPGGRGCPT
eukprot:7388883-Prymnesium_polylepis.1